MNKENKSYLISLPVYPLLLQSIVLILMSVSFAYGIVIPDYTTKDTNLIIPQVEADLQTLPELGGTSLGDTSFKKEHKSAAELNTSRKKINSSNVLKGINISNFNEDTAMLTVNNDKRLELLSDHNNQTSKTLTNHDIKKLKQYEAGVRLDSLADRVRGLAILLAVIIVPLVIFIRLLFISVRKKNKRAQGHHRGQQHSWQN